MKHKTLLIILLFFCVTRVNVFAQAPSCIDECHDTFIACVDGCAGNPSCLTACADAEEACNNACNEIPIEDHLPILFFGGIMLLALATGRKKILFTRIGKVNTKFTQ